MSFQIRNAQGEAIPINILDKEAAKFWGKALDPKKYAYPHLRADSNWFDILGWAIYCPERYTEGWDDVKCTLWVIQSKDLYKYIINNIGEILVRSTEIRDFLKPYFDLVDH